MECVENALKKGSLSDDAAVKTAGEFPDDLWANNFQTSVDEFFVDDLLDFSNGGMGPEEEEEEGEAGEDKGCVVSVSPKEEEGTESCNPKSKGEFCSLPASELSVPADDLADLEWLSRFVEDSFSEYSLTQPTGNLVHKPNESSEKNRSGPEIPEPCFNAPVPAKSRTKRCRTGVGAWGSRSDSSSSSSTSSSSTSGPSWLVYAHSNFEPRKPLPPPPARRQSRKPANDGEKPAAPRRCSHCGVQKTPQWRAGPRGAKTLCNACGVRFKSGRLLPEYRPACSPTFSSDVHSNSHRKVLEMRRKKEGVAGPAVQSF